MFGANSSAAKTFLSPTLTKRKREQLSKSVDKGSESSYKTGRRDLRRLLKVFVPKELISNEDLGDCVLFPSGEVLVFDDDKVTVFSILRRQGQDVPVAPVVVPVNTAGMDSLFEEAQLGPGPLDSRVLVCCSASGRLIIALIDQGNKVVVGEHHVLLTEDEAVTTVCRAG